MKMEKEVFLHIVNIRMCFTIIVQPMRLDLTISQLVMLKNISMFVWIQRIQDFYGQFL